MKNKENRLNFKGDDKREEKATNAGEVSGRNPTVDLGGRKERTNKSVDSWVKSWTYWVFWMSGGLKPNTQISLAIRKWIWKVKKVSFFPQGPNYLHLLFWEFLFIWESTK